MLCQRGKTCSTNAGKAEHIEVIGLKAKRKEAIRKTKKCGI
jgi:hypothetical protein